MTDLPRTHAPTVEEMAAFMAAHPTSRQPALEYYLEKYATLREPLTPDELDCLQDGMLAFAGGRTKKAMLGLGAVEKKFGFESLCQFVWRTTDAKQQTVERIVSFASCWFDAGLPQVVLGHKLAASLMATQTTEEVAPMIRPPWKAFFINVPNGLLFVEPKESASVISTEVSHLFVSTDDGKWSITVISEPKGNADGFTTAWKPVTTEQLARGSFEATSGSEFMATTTSLVLATRLVVGVCLLMADPSTVKPPKGATFPSANKERAKAPPVTGPQTFVVGAPVTIDCRAELRALQEGKGASVTVRFIVRGHWKMQPHGPGRQQRKVIWIQPYWKGDEGMPMLVRPHVIKKELQENAHGKEEPQAAHETERTETSS